MLPTAGLLPAPRLERVSWLSRQEYKYKRLLPIYYCRTPLPPYNSSVSSGSKRSQQYSWTGTIWGERSEGNRAGYTGTQQELCRTTAAYWNEWEQSTLAHCLWSLFAGNLYECFWLLCALERDTGGQRSSDCRLTFYATEEKESSKTAPGKTT